MAYCKIFLITFFFWAWDVSAELRKARIYPVGKAQGEPRYLQETNIDSSAAGSQIRKSQIVDLQGQVIMTEVAEIREGKIIFQQVEQRQIQEAYELRVEAGVASFKTFALKDQVRGKMLEEKKVALGSRGLLMGPSTEIFLQGRWRDLIAGEKLEVDFGVFELSRIVGFQFRQLKATEKTVQVEMKPSNFFIAMLVKPILLEFTKDEKRLVRYVGRTPLREMVQGKWEPLDAEILYH